MDGVDFLLNGFRECLPAVFLRLYFFEGRKNENSEKGLYSVELIQ